MPLCLTKMFRAVSRRDFLKRTSVGAAAAAAGTTSVLSAQRAEPASVQTIRFKRTVDLTHTLTPDFPTWSGQQQLAVETLSRLAADGWNVKHWRINEHTGTHLDAPLHKSDGPSADLIPVEDLIGPLARIDIRRKAAADANAELTPDDVQRWEAQHGRLAEGTIVAMCSGWDAHLRSSKFRNADPEGTLHFPGLHLETADLLLERRVKGLVVDTLSLDVGQSKSFPVHLRWLGAQRWGLECAARLGDLPPAGAFIIVGGPKIAGATGGPSRVLALVN